MGENTADRPYGYSYKVRFHPNSGIPDKIFRKKGSERSVRRAGLLKRNSIEVFDLEPYTREQWLRCFGEGRM